MNVVGYFLNLLIRTGHSNQGLAIPRHVWKLRSVFLYKQQGLNENAFVRIRENMKFDSFAKIVHISILRKCSRKSNNCVCTHENVRNFFLQLLQKNHIFSSCHAHLLLSYTYVCENFRENQQFSKICHNCYFYIIKHLLIAQHYHTVYSIIIRETFFCLFVLLIITGMERGNSCFVK